jgi:Tol biopolymer transport system component
LLRALAAGFTILGISAIGWPVMAGSPTTIRASVRTNGDQADDASNEAAISGNGRYVAFQSYADNLSTQDDDDSGDVFVHDRRTGKTKLVSIRPNGVAGDDHSTSPSLSSDGRFITFESAANTLSGRDNNLVTNVFVKDMVTGRLRLAGVRSDGDPANNSTFQPAISASGRFVAFTSNADNLPSGDSAINQIYVHDLEGGTTRLISKRSNGTPGDASSSHPSMAASGQYVAFESAADNLSGVDDDGFDDVFVHDRETGATRLVSRRTNGDPATGNSSRTASISGNGRYISFESDADNLSGLDDDDHRSIYVRDMERGRTTLVSVRSNGDSGDHKSGDASISADGRYVLFESRSTNLSNADSDAGGPDFPLRDVFIHDRGMGRTRLLSIGHDGSPADQESGFTTGDGYLSRTGVWAVFPSGASYLVPNDTNGFSDIFLRGPLH